MVSETVVDYNFCFPVGCNPPVFFMFILTFMGDAFLFGTDIQSDTTDKINCRL